MVTLAFEKGCIKFDGMLLGNLIYSLTHTRTMERFDCGC